MEKYMAYAFALVAIVSLAVAVYGYVTFQEQIAGLESSVSNLEENLITVQEKISEYQSSITELEGELSEYKEVTLIDDMGYVLTLTAFPERIVSLSPANTEILFAVGAGNKVVGVTDYCDYPHDFTAWIEAGNMTSIGNYWQPAVEPIIALDPDLIFATSASEEAAESLRKLGYNVLIVEGKTLDAVLQNILLVGRATGNHLEAGEIVAELRQRIDVVATKALDATSTPTVYHEVWGPEDIMSAGPGTFIDEMITLAGGQNIFHDAASAWPFVNSETIIERNPDIIVMPKQYMGTQFWGTFEDVKNRPGWNSINAIKNGRLYEIDASIISRSAPRLVDALEILAEMIHPEIFGYP